MPSHYLNDFLARQKRRANLDLVEKWVPSTGPSRILKTDLFDEAMGGEGLLDGLAASGRRLVGIDINCEVAASARTRLGSHSAIVIADVRCLPFADGAFDAIVSNSTLDHFHSRADIDVSLGELARIVAADGVLVVTLDNPQNVFYPLLRAVASLGLTPFRLGPTCSALGLHAGLERAGFQVTDTAMLIHNPRLLPTGLLFIARSLGSAALARGVERLQAWFARFEGTRWQHLTGCFVAARGVKRGRHR